MTIAFTKMLPPMTPKVETPVAKPIETKSAMASSQSKFDAYLTANTTEQQAPQNNEAVQAETAEVIERVEEVMSAETIEEVAEVLELPIDEQTLLVPIGPDGELVAIDELMNLEDIAALLNIDIAELEQMLTELLNEDVQLDDLADLLTLVEEQGPQLMAQLTAALQGETKLVPKEVEKVVHVLKVMEVLSPKADMTMQQEQQITSLKDMLQLLQKEVAQLTKPAEVVKAPQPLIVQQVVNFQQNVVAASAKTAGAEVATEQTMQPVQQQQAPKVQTITVTLPPTNQSAQSEALAKEMQAIIQRQQIANQQGTLKLAIKLYPENLGTIRLELMHKDGLLTARLMASTAVGKEMLESQLQQLKQGLAAQNIQLERIEITQSLQDSTRNMNSSDQHLFNNFFQREQQSEEDDDEEHVEEQASFDEFLQQMKEGDA